MPILSGIQMVGTPFAFIAFILVVVLYAFKARLNHRRKVIESLPSAERAEYVTATLRLFKVDTAKLTRQRQYDLALKQIQARENRFRLWLWAAVFFGVVLALLTTAVTKFSSDYKIKSADFPQIDGVSAMFIPESDGLDGKRAQCAREKAAYLYNSLDRRSEGLPPLPAPQCEFLPSKHAWELTAFFSNSGKTAAEDLDFFINTPSTGILEKKIGRVATGVRPKVDFDNLEAASYGVALCISWLTSTDASARQWAVFSRGPQEVAIADYVPKIDDGTFQLNQDGCREKLSALLPVQKNESNADKNTSPSNCDVELKMYNSAISDAETDISRATEQVNQQQKRVDDMKAQFAKDGIISPSPGQSISDCEAINSHMSFADKRKNPTCSNDLHDETKTLQDKYHDRTAHENIKIRLIDERSKIIGQCSKPAKDTQ